MEGNSMSIKYHEYGKGYDYGADHTLTDNWNPDADYGNEYASVYFNIDTVSFDCMNGSFNNTSDSEQWHEEVTAVIEQLGIVESCGYKTTTAYLHAHPQIISGVVLKNNIRKIAETIDNMKLSSIRWVDIRETVYNISDREYEDYLNGRRDEIRKELFTASTTTRTTKYYNAFDVARSLAGKFRLNRLGLNDGKNYGGGQTIDYILNVANEMIDEGLLKFFERDGEKYIRSLNKTEQKQMKVKFV